MYIEPSTNIRLLNGVHLDPTYQHTIYFADATAQATYFISKTKHNLTDYYFQRKDRGVVKVKVPIGQLYDCNYMMYKNTEFSNKWFYAFITNVEYANNGSSYVYFQIDVMQTWFFDYEILDSFVLRDHYMPPDGQTLETAGDNIVPEEVTADIQFINSVNEQEILCDYNSVLHTTYDTEEPDPDNPGKNKFEVCIYKDQDTGMVTPYQASFFSLSGNMEGYLQNFLENGHADAILCVYPKYSDVSVSLSRPSQIGTYIPRNKKLLTGQYCKYSFELAGNIMDVPLDVVPSPTVTNRAAPAAVLNRYALNEYRVFLTQYNAAAKPTSMSIAIPIEPFKWAFNNYANNANLNGQATAMMLSRENVEKTRDITSAGFNIATGEAGVLTGIAGAIATGGASLAVGGATQIMSASGRVADAGFREYELLSNIDEHSEAISRHRANMKAPATGASVNSNALMFNRQLYLSGYVWTVLPQDAERIDRFFDMYGYAQNRLKKPNRNGRTHWNYVKTAGLEIHSNCPQEDMKTIVKIYENGITFWNNGDEIGNYNLDNTLH